MKKFLLYSLIAVFLGTGPAFALTLNLSGWNDMTIWDRESPPTYKAGTNGYDGSSDIRTNSDIRDNFVYAVREDKETEGSTTQQSIGSQDWDLEGVFIKGNSLALVGGYNFMGVSGHWTNSAPGDLFIDLNTDFLNPAGVPAGGTTNSALNYNYVFDLNYGDRSNPGAYTYTVKDLTFGSIVTNNANDFGDSSPWTLASGGTDLGFGTGTAQYYTGISGVTFDGTNHYALVFDLSYLGLPTGVPVSLYSHFTMQCGNDNLMGYTSWTPETNVPEPGAMLLLGTCLLGMAIVGRKKLY
jgi:hypothetical protein